MNAVDEFIVYSIDDNHYQLFGVHYNVYIYKHNQIPLRIIFDRGLQKIEVSFQLEEFESIVTLDQMLPIYARDVYRIIDDTIYREKQA